MSDLDDFLEGAKKTLKTAGLIVVAVGSVASFINVVKGLTPNIEKKLHALVFHVCEKEWTHAPDVHHIYKQILALNQSKYNMFICPEYGGHESFEKDLQFLKEFENEYSIPIMLEVFSGGSHPTPLQQLTTDQIMEAMKVCNVLWLRINEIVSWYAGRGLPFPSEWVLTILRFCREHGLKLFWSEWDAHSIPTMRSTVKGYEDIITVAFQTNSEIEPRSGFTIMQEFQHWGASVQAWYWVTRHEGSDCMNMPIPLMIEHSLLARDMGAEIIQFEPYWYFFDNGEARESLQRIVTAL